jgi:hypothetical protein
MAHSYAQLPRGSSMRIVRSWLGDSSPHTSYTRAFHRPSRLHCQAKINSFSLLIAFCVSIVSQTVFCVCAWALPKQILTITSPRAAQIVSGEIAISVSTNNPAAMTVEFTIGSLSLGTSVLPSTAITWNTGNASDGTYVVQASLRSKTGLSIGTAVQQFTINNHGNSLVVTAPDLTKPISGNVKMSMNGSDSQHYPALWMVDIDGQNVTVAWTDNNGTQSDSLSPSVDTTHYLNGEHELYVAMHSDFWPPGEQNQKTNYDWTAAYEHLIDIENGHTLMGVSANYLHVYLRPGGSTTLSCEDLFTDYTSTKCLTPTFTVGTGGGVAVSSTGIVTAGASEGFSIITVSDGKLSTQVYVWVRSGAGMPQFAGDGEMLAKYTPGKSLFVVAPFDLASNMLAADSGLLSSVHKSGVNTISEGFYQNPRDIGATFASWQWFYDTFIAPRWAFAKANNFHILATGDEVCRNIGSEAWWTLNWPSGKAAVQYAMAGLAASGVAIGVDMVDEVNDSWGGTPTPPGTVGAPGSFSSITCSSGNCAVTWPINPVGPGRFPSGSSFALDRSANSQLNTPSGQMFNATAPTGNSFNFVAAGPINGTFDATTDPDLEFLWWAGNIGGCPTQPCDPPVPNDALLQITSWLHEVPHVPISWPVAGNSPISAQANWMGRGSISDYASQYWVPLNYRHTYTWGASVQEQGYWMSQSFYQSQSVAMIDRPQLLLDSIAGPAYQKNNSSDPYYTPPVDKLIQPGPTPAAITSSIMTAAALGAAGVRLYYFEDPSNEGARAAAGSGSVWQTGANPTANDPIIQANWQALASASTALTKLLTPFVLGNPLNSPAYGPNIITAVRQGSNGKMLMIVNDNDWQRILSVDFTPYRTNTTATRYLVNAHGIIKASLPRATSHDLLTLGAGETVVYLFPNISSY